MHVLGGGFLHSHNKHWYQPMPEVFPWGRLFDTTYTIKHYTTCLNIIYFPEEYFNRVPNFFQDVVAHVDRILWRVMVCACVQQKNFLSHINLLHNCVSVPNYTCNPLCQKIHYANVVSIKHTQLNFVSLQQIS